MLKVIAGDQCERNEGIMPSQMNCKNKLENCKWIVIAGLYQHITILTYDPMVVEAIDLWKEKYGTEVRYFLDGKDGRRLDENGNLEEIQENELYRIYSNLGRIYDDINTIKLARILDNKYKENHK